MKSTNGRNFITNSLYGGGKMTRAVHSDGPRG